VIVGGEVATPAMRLRIRETFAAPLYETYASHECPLLAWECRHSGDLHTCDDGVLVEVLRDGRAVDPGDRGEVIVTNLYAYAMPFLRYRIGDLATRGAPCGCGAPFSTIGEIQGRMIDYFPLPDGRLLHPYEIVSRLVWGPREWMKQYQLVQERRDRVVLYAVADQQPSPERVEGVARVVRPILGPGVSFELRLVGRIPFESTGKLRPSRSLVHSAYDRVRFQPVEPPAGARGRRRGA
jgi:phenylacetate-CoA ligase